MPLKLDATVAGQMTGASINILDSSVTQPAYLELGKRESNRSTSISQLYEGSKYGARSAPSAARGETDFAQDGGGCVPESRHRHAYAAAEEFQKTIGGQYNSDWFHDTPVTLRNRPASLVSYKMSLERGVVFHTR
jgi:hypothetical protein